jgi:Multicopper oxidase.
MINSPSVWPTVCFVCFSAESLVSYAGERFDFVLHANKKVGNYWMRFRGLMDCDERFTKAHQVAVLHYVGAPPNKEPPGEVSYEESRRKGLVSMEYQWKGAQECSLIPSGLVFVVVSVLNKVSR